MYIENEEHLHINVIEFIRDKYPDAIINPGLGELQRTSEDRIISWRKGYQKGTADIIISNRHFRYVGLAIQLKTTKGTGHLSDEQIAYLRNMEINGFKVMISNNYNDIIIEITQYMNGLRLICPKCLKRKKLYKTKESLDNHMMTFHRCSLSDVQTVN